VARQHAGWGFEAECGAISGKYKQVVIKFIRQGDRLVTRLRFRAPDLGRDVDDEGESGLTWGGE
jgi:hypothetical protein